MSDNLLYLKFLLDPIVYAWRMLNYRDSFGKIYCPHKDIGGESKVTGIERSTTELNQSAITLSSFKTLPIEWVWIWIFDHFERKAADYL